MDIIKNLAGARVYVDSNIFIYAFENLEELGRTCAGVLAHIDTGALKGVISELVLVELLVGPLRRNARDLAADYERRIDISGGLEVVPLTRPILRLAALLRSTGKFKTPDALHVSTALDRGCEGLVTADRGIKSTHTLPVFYVS